ncbi:putative bacterial sensory transduction regulator|nr:putative bacterial sensory transduction regulator [Candidatus Pantoea persica]
MGCLTPKSIWSTTLFSFSALAEVKPTALIPLIVCQSLGTSAGLTFGQFAAFMKQSEEQLSMVIMEAFANNLLMMGEEEEERPLASFSHSLLH